MGKFTKDELQELREFDNSLNEEQKDWVKHKCNWEQQTRYAILRDYRSHIEGLGKSSK